MKVNQLKSGVILSYVSKIIQIVVGILYTPLMIRLLGQSEYGLYNIAASIISYLGVLNFGFGSAYMRFYSRYRVNADQKKIANLNGMFIEIFTTLGLLAVIAGIGIVNNVDILFGPSLTANEIELAKILISILVINLAFSFPTVVFTTYIQAQEQFVVQNLIMIFNQITTPLITFPLLLMGYGSVGLVVGTTLVSVVTNLYTVYFAIRKSDMKISFKEFDWSLFKEMSNFSFFVFINMVVDQINNNVDKTILGRYQGTTSVAIYSVGSNLNNYYTQLSTSVSSVFIPRVHRMEAKNSSNEEFSNLFIKVGRIQFILLSLILTGFIIFGQSFINLWAGSGYSESYYVAVILMVTITTPLIQNLGIEIQRAKNKHHFRSILYIAMAILNVMLSIPLSQRYGALGSTIGTAISFIVGNGLIMNWYNQTKVGLDIKRFWFEILKLFPSLILPLIYGLTIINLVDIYSPFNLIVYGSIYVVVFAFSLWIFGLNDYEKNILKNPFK